MKDSLDRNIPEGEAVLCRQCKTNWHNKKHQYCFPCALKLGLVEETGDYEWCSLYDKYPDECMVYCDFYINNSCEDSKCPFVILRKSYRLTEKGKACGLTSRR